MKAINAQLPGEHIAIDLAGPLPLTENKNVRLLVVVDVARDLSSYAPCQTRKV